VQGPLLQSAPTRKNKNIETPREREILGSFGLTEAAAGSDAQAFKPRPRVAQPLLALHPDAIASTREDVGHERQRRGRLHCVCENRSAAGGKGITAFLIEPSFKGFKMARHGRQMGQRSPPSVEIL